PARRGRELAFGLTRPVTRWPEGSMGFRPRCLRATPMETRGLFRWNERTGFMLALIAPAALVLVLFQVVPILTGANARFRDWTLHDPKRTWVGLANYLHVLRDADFLWIVLPNTFGFMVATVACSLVLGLLIALMLNRRFPGRWLVQSFVLLPLMVAPVIA